MTQRLDASCSKDCCVSPDGLSVTIGTGTVVCAEGYDEGRHYWEFVVERAGWYTWAGVTTRDRGDESEVLCGHLLPGMEGGYAVAGWCNGPGELRAMHAHEEERGGRPLELFQPGDRVGLLLDCDAGTLAYYRGGRKVADVFPGWLRGCGKLYPAFACSGLETHITGLRFDAPPPPGSA
eukprot:m51a1_g10315 hypothetical protein (179) ;mRNA; r:3805-4901